jgi:hypothetical protein
MEPGRTLEDQIGERGTTMLNVIARVQGESLPYNPDARGYHVLYRENAVNHCPGCGRTHWYIGRVSAECGFCGTALALAEATARGAGGFSRGHNPLWVDEAA